MIIKLEFNLVWFMAATVEILIEFLLLKYRFWLKYDYLCPNFDSYRQMINTVTIEVFNEMCFKFCICLWFCALKYIFIFIFSVRPPRKYFQSALYTQYTYIFEIYKFICPSFRNMYKCEPLVIFPNRFRCECKALDRILVYIYCVLSFTVSEVQIKPNDKVPGNSRTNHRSNRFEWCPQWRSRLYCISFLHSLYMNMVQKKTFFDQWLK